MPKEETIPPAKSNSYASLRQELLLKYPHGLSSTSSACSEVANTKISFKEQAIVHRIPRGADSVVRQQTRIHVRKDLRAE